MAVLKLLTAGLALVALYSMETSAATAATNEVVKEVKELKGQAAGNDCSHRHNWPLHFCPDGDGWQCWRDAKRRDVNCKEYDWGNRVSLPNTRGFGWCYCCGRCRVPENLFAR